VRAALGGLALPVLFALVALLLFIGLGTWQLDRKSWKEALIATLTERARAAPVDLPDAANWPTMNQADDEFRRVSFRAEFLPGREAVVYSSGSALRPDAKTPGYFVFAPARTPGGAMVVINRGFSPDARARAPDSPKPPGMIEMVGALRWPERAGWFVPEHDEADDTWFARNHAAMAAHNEWGFAGPFYVELERPAPPGGVPQPGPLKVNLRNEHLQYAITWYGLAAVVVVMFGFWLRAHRRRADEA
jgi:cytochrome oxidase assembly protein ShyY1